MNTGIFISLEGVDASGKSTMVDHIAQEFEKMGRVVVKTREPGGTIVSSKLRDILINTEKETIDPVAQLLMFLSSRIQNIQNIIIPALLENKIVICDRFMDSAVCYQGCLKGLQWTIESLSSIDSLRYLKERPDHTIFFNVDPDVSLSRATSRGELNQLDKEYLDEREKIVYYFRKHFESIKFIEDSSKYSIHTVNSNVSIDEVKQVLSTMIQDNKLNCKKNSFFKRITHRY